MLDDSNRMVIIDPDSGQEREMEILLTVDSPDGAKHFVIYRDPLDDEENAYACLYDEDGGLEEITDENDWEFCEEVLAAWREETGEADGEEKA